MSIDLNTIENPAALLVEAAENGDYETVEAFRQAVGCEDWEPLGNILGAVQARTAR